MESWFIRTNILKLWFIRENPTAQIAHLVFADKQANPKNQKSYFFATAHRE